MRGNFGVCKTEIIRIIAFQPVRAFPQYFKCPLLFQAFLDLQLTAVLDLFMERSQTTSFGQDVTNCLASPIPVEERLSGCDQKREVLLLSSSTGFKPRRVNSTFHYSLLFLLLSKVFAKNVRGCYTYSLIYFLQRPSGIQTSIINLKLKV